MKIAWDPLILAALTAAITVVLYLYGKAPRFAGFLAAATVMFTAVGVPSVLALAHHPLTAGLALLIVVAGAFGAVAAFFLIVVKGHHKRPLLKRKGQGAAAGGGGSEKGAHHRAMAATVFAMVFTFLLIQNWHAVAQVGQGGISQTVNEVTQ